MITSETARKSDPGMKEEKRRREREQEVQREEWRKREREREMAKERERESTNANQHPNTEHRLYPSQAEEHQSQTHFLKPRP